MRYAVIMAGGAGKRLWPLSRVLRPKQLLPLLEGRSLLELAVERLEGLFETANTLVVTNAEYAQQIAEAIPAIPPENVIGEPEGRDTANAIVLATQIIAAKDDEATMAVFTADHVIRPADRFAEAVRAACKTAEETPDALVTFGIRPNWPHTGLGYIHCGKSLGKGVHEVTAFREKPDHSTARRYVESGQHFWNSGMFVWKLGAIRQALQEFLPDSWQKLSPVAEAAGRGSSFADILTEAYPTLEKISIDFAVMEKAPTVIMVELNCEWLDVGSWPALEQIAELDEDGNVVVAKNVAVLDSSRNVIVSEDDHLLAVLEIDDCIVVHAADATLVCDKSDSQQLKELLAHIEKTYGKKYL